MANLAFKDIYDDIQLFEREEYEQMLAECDQSGFHYLISERGQLQVDVDEGPETDALWPVFHLLHSLIDRSLLMSILRDADRVELPRVKPDFSNFVFKQVELA